MNAKIILILMCYGSFIFLSASVFGNNWLKDEYRNIGLWRRCYTFSGTTSCNEFSMTLDNKFVCRAFAATSLLLTVVGGIIALVRLCKELDGRIVGGFFLVAGVCMLIALAVYTYFSKDSRMDYGWSYILGWISMVLCFVTGVMNILIKWEARLVKRFCI